MPLGSTLGKVDEAIQTLRLGIPARQSIKNRVPQYPHLRIAATFKDRIGVNHEVRIGKDQGPASLFCP